MSATRERVHVAADIDPAVCDKAALKTVAITKGDDNEGQYVSALNICLLYTSPSPRDGLLSRMPSSA